MAHWDSDAWTTRTGRYLARPVCDAAGCRETPLIAPVLRPGDRLHTFDYGAVLTQLIERDGGAIDAFMGSAEALDDTEWSRVLSVDPERTHAGSAVPHRDGLLVTISGRACVVEGGDARPAVIAS